MDDTARYDRDASRYHQGVYSRKRLDLHATITSTLSPLFLGQLKNLHKSCLSAFKSALHDTVSGGMEYNFGDIVSKATNECETRFQVGGKEVCIEEKEWSWEEELFMLREEIATIAEVFRKDETKKTINLIEVRMCWAWVEGEMLSILQRNFKKQIAEPVDIALNKATPDMWDKVLGSFQQLLGKAESSYLKKAKGETIVCLSAYLERMWSSVQLHGGRKYKRTIIASYTCLDGTARQDRRADGRYRHPRQASHALRRTIPI